MKKLILLLLVTVPLFLRAQEVEVGDEYGIFVSYQLEKLKDNGKRVTYRMNCWIKNTNDYAVYYEGATAGTSFHILAN